MNARERVRRRYDRWTKGLPRPRQQKILEALKTKGISRGQSWVSKLAQRGPRLEDLDVIADLMGSTAEKLVAPLDHSERAVERARELAAEFVTSSVPPTGTLDASLQEGSDPMPQQLRRILVEMLTALPQEELADLVEDVAKRLHRIYPRGASREPASKEGIS